MILDDISNDRAKAFAYGQLGDTDMCIKFHEKYIKKNITDDLMFKTQQQIITEQSCQYEEDDTIGLLSIFFRDLNQMIRETYRFEEAEILKVADSCFQCGLLYKQKSSYLESTNAFIFAFSLYMSKFRTDTNQLINDINNLLNVFVQGTLHCDEVLVLGKGYLKSKPTELMRLKVAALYREDEIYNVEDLDGDDDTSNESRNIAFQRYKDLLKETNDNMVRGVCFFHILNLYKKYIYEDDDGKSIVESMMNVLPTFSICDRRLLVKLAIHFMAEYDSNKGTCDMKINRRLQKMEKDYFDEKLELQKDKCIGQYLVDCDDLDGVEEYWKLIGQQIENSIPHWILSLVQDPNSIFDDILQTIKQPENDTVLLLNQLVSTYESLGDYYMLDAKNDQTAGANYFQQAEIMYTNASHVLNRLKADSERIRNIKIKHHEAVSRIKPNAE